MARSRKRKQKEVVKLENLKQVNLNAAGLDIGDAEIWACVPEGRDEEAVRKFGTFTVDLHALADWLGACGVDTVALESTGVYWIPCYEILAARGFEVNLINAQHIKNVPGRKSDYLDRQWIQQLHTFALLRASFRPDEDMRALRDLIRHRDNLIRYAGMHVQHMQKALQLMNVKLTQVVRDIAGQTGMLIIRDIIAGERDAEKLAAHRNYRCKKSEAEIAKTLNGNYQAEHVLALKQAIQLYDFYHELIGDCDAEIEKRYSAFKPRIDIESNPLPPRRTKRGNKPRKNEPTFDLRTHLYELAGVDLTQVDGLDMLTVQTVISGIGLDMSKWDSSKHFTSWLGVSPNVDKSGGKVTKRGTKKTQNRAAKALRLAARSLAHSDSGLGSHYRRMRSKLGSPGAITATAHKLARIFYAMLRDQTEYQDPGADYYEQQYQQRALKNLTKKAKKLGYDLVPLTEEAAAA